MYKHVQMLSKTQNIFLSSKQFQMKNVKKPQQIDCWILHHEHDFFENAKNQTNKQKKQVKKLMVVLVFQEESFKTANKWIRISKSICLAWK